MGDRFTNLWSRLRGGAKGPLGPTALTLGEGVVVDGRFAVKGLLGIGGTSAVYIAEQTSMGREVALKILRSELITREQATDRFVREVRAISRLSSPHTVSVYDVGRTPEGLLFIAMELLRGRSLFQVMSDEPGPMSPWRAVQIVDQVLESLAEAHASGVLHRDLKPENIFVIEGTAAKEFAKVLDFGIAQLGDEAAVETQPRGMVVGTPRYMSPEQMSGKPLDARSDLYSLATVLFEMLSGHPPFEAATPLALGYLFAGLRKGTAISAEEAEAFRTALLLEVGRMDARRGWAMQLHLAAIRNLNTAMFQKLGPDTGYDAAGDEQVARKLAAFLDALARDGQLPKTILYSLNPNDYEVLCSIMGCFQEAVPGKLQLGSAWWHNDHLDGMRRQMNCLASIGLLSRFVGMLTDSRSFLSFPRHEYFRRLLCAMVGGWMETGEAPADFESLGGMVQDICYRNAKAYFAIPGVND